MAPVGSMDPQEKWLGILMKRLALRSHLARTYRLRQDEFGPLSTAGSRTDRG
jgi:hypothetical protein